MHRLPERAPRGHRDGPAGWHLHLLRTKGYGQGTLAFRLLRLADLQRVDMGIAMCHFELAAREAGLAGSWVFEDPGLVRPEDGAEHVAIWREDAAARRPPEG